MQRASIKRSFNCEDLSSIDGLDSHLTRAMEAQGESGHENEYYSRKRRKAMSLDSSSWTTSIKSIPLQQPPSVAASVSNDSITPKTTSTLAVASSTTTSCVATATAITPDKEVTPSPSPSDELGSLPYFPSLRRNRSVSCDFPATAALDQMLKHRRSPTNVMGNDSSHSLEEREEDQWPSFQEEDDTKNFLPSPRHNVEDFAYMRRVSLSRPSSTTSSSSCTLSLNNNHPNSIIKSRSPPTVNQITEALESLARI